MNPTHTSGFLVGSRQIQARSDVREASNFKRLGSNEREESLKDPEDLLVGLIGCWAGNIGFKWCLGGGRGGGDDLLQISYSIGYISSPFVLKYLVAFQKVFKHLVLVNSWIQYSGAEIINRRVLFYPHCFPKSLDLVD